MDLSIIIVNWNSKNYLKDCLDSILEQSMRIKYEIIVIDNASYDGADQIIADNYPIVSFIQSDENIGFAKANNVAFNESTGRLLLFLNPDTKIIGSAIEKMSELIYEIDQVGALGCLLLNGDQSIQTSCIQTFPTILNQTLKSNFMMSMSPNSKLWGMAPLYKEEGQPQEVEVISGACLMVKRHVFKKVGRFSNDYFMYAEDLDLCYKIREAGYKNIFTPKSKVIHFGEGSTSKGPSEFSSVVMRESIRRFLNKTKGSGYSMGYKVSMFCTSIVRMGLLLVSYPIYFFKGKGEYWRASLNKWIAICRWCFNIWVFEKK